MLRRSAPALSLCLFACSSQPPLPAVAEQPAGLPTSRVFESDADPSAASTDGGESPRCFGPKVAFSLKGQVVGPDGGVPDQPIGVKQADGSFREVARTDAEGSYSIAVDGPVVYTVTSRQSTPGEACSFPDELLDQPELLALLEGTQRRGATFKVGDACPLTVVTRGPDGSLVPGAEVYAMPFMAFGEGSLLGVTDEDGQLVLPDAPCFFLPLSARTPGLLSVGEDARALAGSLTDCSRFSTTPTTCVEAASAKSPRSVELHLAEGRILSGKVTDPDGSPIEGATVIGRYGSAETDVDGRYTIPMYASPTWVSVITVKAAGYNLSGSGLIAGRYEQATPPRSLGDESWTRDFTLTPGRVIEVRCLGIAAEACEDMFVECEWPGDLNETRRSCGLGSKHECTCPPEGPNVLRGGGVAVRVEEGQDLAWLDFRPFTGSISGRMEGDEPCRATVRRDAYFWQPQGFRSLDCAADGTFTFSNLPPGDWDVSVKTTRAGRSRGTSRTVRVEAEPVALGTIGDSR